MRALCALLLCFTQAALADDWPTADKAMLGGALGLLAVDWAQTRYLARQWRDTYATPACADPETRKLSLSGPCPATREPVYRETNPLLPRHPSTAQVDHYFALAMVGTAGISYALAPSYRQYFLGGVLILEGVVVLRNHQLGLRVTF